MTSSTRNSSSPPGDFSLGLNSLSASGTLSSTSPSASSGTGLSYSGSLSSRSSFSVSALTTTSASLQSRPSTSSFNILVISSTTITLSVQPVSSSSSTSIITVITISPSDGSGTSSASTRSDATTAAPPSITTAPVTVEGCGTVTGGSGTVSGSGTVYPALAPFFPVTSVGIASGNAPLVVGCGVLIGTGTFIGSASITGCGEGNGTATLTGSGTVWPAIAGRDQTTLSFTSSGIISGSGRVSGCGTLTGSGTFTITDVYTPIPTASRSTVTVEVYASYCGPSEDIGAFGLNRIASNGTSDPLSDVDAAAADKDSTNRFHNDTVTFSSSLRNATDPSANNSTQKTDPNPSCIECPNSGGICCPFDYPCDSVGKCPWEGILAAGYVRFGYNMVMARNLSDGSQVWDEGVSPEAAGVGRVEGGDVPEEVAAARQMYGGAAAAAAGGGVGLGGVGMGVFGGMGQRVAPHPMGGDVGSVLAKRDKEARREEERHRADMQRRGVAEEPHDFVVRADA
ncbi:uncharacterized protein HMPREF1541_02671 [Cyphellophora europaea CBS 101466]|uniref:Uncharacterized protein n=1 Tax=Cyphellophora europaea (strain CBS 101466) TaxID=1220924 RepID=W2S4A0_CYPE1|nr:uncharacterized protein HMPREF1541_02671 [Cyphellophora europaea CBS 101466]ETN43512.1 hypothetical protein HMPREF1541_02671 [Cyphellophora europaea CBS 101466]